MLGEKIEDAVGAETKGSFEGMGLIPVTSVFDTEKITARTEGKVNALEGIFKDISGLYFRGYEIHMGKSDSEDIIVKGKNNVYGTYIHGIFDEKELSETIIKALLSSKGMTNEKIEAYDMRKYKNRQYDILADTVRKSVDIGYGTFCISGTCTPLEKGV